MEQQTLFTVLSLGFSLGLLHALDADHIMAVSLLASRTRRMKSRAAILLLTLGYCIRWSIGHGITLIALSALLLFSSIELPAIVPQLAEKLVGVFLLVLGVVVVHQAVRDRVRLHFHHHGGISHVHLTRGSSASHSHQPVLLGVVHGLAGSAPVLAILPLVGGDKAVVGLVYLCLFSLGVMISMVVFGMFFGRLQQWLSRLGNGIYQTARLILGFASIGFGCYWLYA